MLLRHLQGVVRGFHTVDHVLRRREPDERIVGDKSAVATSRSPIATVAHYLPLRRVIAIILVCGPVYGAAMGAYAFVVGERAFLDQLPQLLFSGVKVPILIALTVVISLPSFFVINTLLGLRDDFREALRAIVSAQAGLTIILVSLFPLTLFSYVSFAPLRVSYSLAILVNAGMFGLASVSSQLLLRAYYRPLIERDPRHRWMVRLWMFVYAFVGIQAAYVLRPFIGNPQLPPAFFRKESFQNAYVKLFELIMDVLRRVFEMG